MATETLFDQKRGVKRFQEEDVWASGKFYIDDNGRIWRSGKRAERLTANGYLQVRVMVNAVRYHTCAHRLAWRALVGPIPAGLVMNHKNGRKDDNRPCNLELLTPSQNQKHAYAAGLVDEHGQRNPSAKLTDNQVAQIRNMYARGGYTMASIAVLYGVRFQHISRIVRGKRRPKQGGPILGSDLRHSVCEKHPLTGRFLGKKAAGRRLDGREWNEMPRESH